MRQSDLYESFFAQKNQLMNGTLLYDKPGCRNSDAAYQAGQFRQADFYFPALSHLDAGNPSQTRWLE